MSDLTNLILKSAYSKIRGKIYNVAGGKEIKVNKIAKLIVERKFLSQNVQVNLIDLWLIYVKLKDFNGLQNIDRKRRKGPTK